MVHSSIKIESWHHIDPRITALRIPYGKRHLFIVSAYAPVQQGNNNAQKTERFYEKLSASTTEARNKGDVVIIGGDMNAPIKQSDAPGLVGKWASNKEGGHVDDLIAFMTEQKWPLSTPSNKPSGETGTPGPGGRPDP